MVFENIYNTLVTFRCTVMISFGLRDDSLKKWKQWTMKWNIIDVEYVYTVGRLPISEANPVRKEGYRVQENWIPPEVCFPLLFFKGTLHCPPTVTISNLFSSILSGQPHFYKLMVWVQVEVETVLIESDMEAKAILDLIPILNIRKLVLGATKSTLRFVWSTFNNLIF